MPFSSNVEPTAPGSRRPGRIDNTCSARLHDRALFSRLRLTILAFGIPIVAGLVGCSAVKEGILAPRQPASGPGGADYSHESVLTQRFGDGADEFWLFFPDHPRPETAPFVVFLHGWTAMNPRTYGAWIRHTVRKGHIVVYPRYQETTFDAPADMLAAASSAVAAAWSRARDEGPVRPLPDKVVWIGHSLGGVLATLLAADSGAIGLPPPAAVLSVEPGGQDRLDLTDLRNLPSDTRVLLVVGEEDRVVGDEGAITLARTMTHMPSGNVEMVTVRSDPRPVPALVANHIAPLAVAEGFPLDPETDAPGATRSRLRDRMAERRAREFVPDALDFYGFWKLSDGLLDASFRDRNLDFAFGDTERQRYMGRLSDGSLVPALLVSRPLDD